MTKVVLDLTTSLDGFVAGPNATLEKPLGEGAEHLHDWLLATESWHRSHAGGHGNGQSGQDSDLYAELTETTGAVVMGRKMFSGGTDPGPTTRTDGAGGATTRLSTSRRSCSPITS